MKRERGTGTFETLKSGKVRGRIRVRGQRPLVVTGEEHIDENGRKVTALEDAKDLLLAARQLVEQARTPTGDDRTFRGLAAQLIASKRARKVRRVVAFEASIQHALQAPWANWSADRIRVDHIDMFVQDLLKKQIKLGRQMKTIAPSTANLVITNISQVFSYGIKKGRLSFNPAAHCDRPKVPKKNLRYFTPDEQHVLLTAPLDETLRLPILFAMGTGLREGEQAFLHLSDLNVSEDNPRLFVRWGSRDPATGELLSPKHESQRYVPLFGIALDAARRWLEILPKFCPDNPLGLVFPREGGTFRQPRAMLGETKSKGDIYEESRFYTVLRRLGLPQRRWHDLRHTCATSLGAGWWGQRWSIDELAQLLGHSETQTTRIYRHVIDSALNEIARRTSGLSTDYPRSLNALNSSTHRAAETSTRSTRKQRDNLDSEAIVDGVWTSPGVRAAAAAIEAQIGADRAPDDAALLALADRADEALADAFAVVRAIKELRLLGAHKFDRALDLCREIARDTPAKSKKKGVAS